MRPHGVEQDSNGEMGRQLVWVLATGGYTRLQYDPVMSDVFSVELGIRRLDGFLGAESRTHVLQNYRVMTAFEPLVADLAPGAGQSSDRGILCGNWSTSPGTSW
jgi:hypothetical protein